MGRFIKYGDPIIDVVNAYLNDYPQTTDKELAELFDITENDVLRYARGYERIEDHTARRTVPIESMGPIAAMLEDFVNNPDQSITTLAIKYNFSYEMATIYITKYWFGKYKRPAIIVRQSKLNDER